MVFHRGMAPSLQNWRGMGNREWGMAASLFWIGEWGMVNGEWQMVNGKWVLSLCE